MENDDLKSLTLELRMLMGMMHKVSRMAVHQRMSAKNIDLGGLQVGILHAVGHQAGQTLGELSKKFFLDPSTLVPTVNGLERKGFVVRKRDPNDRRRWQISLTDTGKTLLDELEMVNDDDPVLMALENMGVEQAQQFMMLFRSLVGNLAEGEEMLDSICNRLDAHHARDINRGAPHERRGEWQHGGGRSHHQNSEEEHSRRRGNKWKQQQDAE